MHLWVSHPENHTYIHENLSVVYIIKEGQMQRHDCCKSIFPHKMYFGEYYSIVRKYPIVV